MRTLLHIGMSKTGSTSLQKTLLASEPALRARGVLFPRNPRNVGYANHKLLLAAGMFDFGRLPRHLTRGESPDSLARKSRRFLDRMRGAVAQHAPRCVILSTESLFRALRGPALSRLPELVGDPDATTVVAYLRRPSEHYASSLQQHLKASHAVRQPKPVKTRGILKGYAGVFGDAALAPRLFHRKALVDGDIVADFVAAHLAPYGVTRADLAPAEPLNATLSAESADLSRRFRFAFHAEDNDRLTRASRTMVAALRAADGAVGAPRPRLKPEVAESVDYARTDPLWLRDAHGLVFPDFDYARLERKDLAAPPGRDLALEEIVEIDRARQRAILAELRASDWAGAKRRAWIDGLLADLA